MTDTTQIAARRHAPAEVDALRREIKAKLLKHLLHDPGGYPSSEVIEDCVRTAMMAGITAEEYEASRKEEGHD